MEGLSDLQLPSINRDVCIVSSAVNSWWVLLLSCVLMSTSVAEYLVQSGSCYSPPAGFGCRPPSLRELGPCPPQSVTPVLQRSSVDCLEHLEISILLDP